MRPLFPTNPRSFLILFRYAFFLQLLFGLLPLAAQNTADIDSLSSLLENDLSDTEKTEIYLGLAKAHVNTDSIQMMRYLDLANEILQLTGDKEARVEISEIIGWYFFQKSKHSQAEEWFNKMLRESSAIDYQSGEAKAYGHIGNTYMFRGQYDTAAVLFTRALDHQKAINDRDGIAINYHNLGNTAFLRGNYDKALEYFRNSLKLKEELGIQDGRLQSILGLGNSFFRKGIYSQALSNYFRALEGFEQMGHYRGISLVTNNIGNIYLFQKDYVEALKFYKKALEGRIALNDEKGIADSYNSIGSVHKSLANYDTAISYISRSLTLKEKIGDQRGTATSLNNLGDIYSSQNKFGPALETLQKSLKIQMDIGDQRGTAHSLLNMTKAYIALGNLAEADLQLREGFLIAEKIGALEQLIQAYKLRAELENKRNRYQEAYKAYVMYKQLADSSLNQENTKKITRLEAEFEFKQELDSVNFEQQKANIAFKDEISKQRTLIQASVGGGISLLIILVLLYRSYMVKRKNNKVLHEKNEEITNLRATEKQMADETIALKERELTTITMLSHERNSLLEQLNTQIGALSSKVDEDVIPELKGIRKTISSNLNEESWSLFMYHFENVHPKFFNSLKEKFSSLTQNDLRLCAYVRVGMNNKEIANISNITSDAVKKSLQRMKKKMSLTVEDDLRVFLMRL